MVLRSPAQRQTADLPRSDEGAVDELLVISLDRARLVKIVDHQAERLPQALPRDVGEPVDPLELRAVVQVKARHRVADGLAAIAAIQQIRGAKSRKRLLNRRKTLDGDLRVARDLCNVGTEPRVD